MQIAENIARMRKKLGLTQSQLAERLYVSNKTVSKWERGAGCPEIGQLVQLSNILGCSIDRLIRGEKNGIAIVGSILTDLIKTVDFFPEVGMLANISSVSMAVGGCVPNTVLDLAKIDPGLRLSAIGAVGEDDAGKYVLHELSHAGVDTEGVLRSKCATGFSDVITRREGGERTFFHHRGANAEFHPNMIDVDALECKMLHAGYILLLDQFDAEDPEYGTVMARFLARVQAAGISTSVDVVSSGDTSLFARKVVPALKYTDNAIMNEIEAGATAGISARDENGKLNAERMIAILKKLSSFGVGERVIVHCPEAGFAYNKKTDEVTVVPSLKLPAEYVKGTVGAGDAFCAGCLYGIYNGYGDREILEFASGAAALCLRAGDSVSGMGPKSEIETLIANTARLPKP